MRNDFFPPRDPPLPLDCFTAERSTRKMPFNPDMINLIIQKYAAGIPSRPSAEQLREWMNEESAIPSEYHEAIRDTIGKMRGHDMMTFRQYNGASLRGFVHLIHETGAFTDRVVHYVDRWSDVGDPRPRWDLGYAGITYGM